MCFVVYLRHEFDIFDLRLSCLDFVYQTRACLGFRCVPRAPLHRLFITWFGDAFSSIHYTASVINKTFKDRRGLCAFTSFIVYHVHKKSYICICALLIEFDVY